MKIVRSFYITSRRHRARSKALGMTGLGMPIDLFCRRGDSESVIRDIALGDAAVVYLNFQRGSGKLDAEGHLALGTQLDSLRDLTIGVLDDDGDFGCGCSQIVKRDGQHE